MSNLKTFGNYVALSVIFSLSFPWWALFVPAIMTGWILAVNKQQYVFLKGFMLTGILWLVMAFVKSGANGFELASRLSETFTLPHESLFFLVIFVVGGLIGGSGMLAGEAAKKILMLNY